VSEVDEHVRSSAYELSVPCELQRLFGIDLGLDPLEDCLDVIDQEVDALTVLVGTQSGIISILNEKLNGPWGQCYGMSNQMSRISIEVEKMETHTLINTKTYGGKQLTIVETDVHERLHAHDWEAHGKFYRDHQDICDQDDKLKTLIKESDANWNSQRTGPDVRLFF